VIRARHAYSSTTRGLSVLFCSRGVTLVGIIGRCKENTFRPSRVKDLLIVAGDKEEKGTGEGGEGREEREELLLDLA
jgi:hypothetical protein